jgi:hypothetical protein
MSLNLIPPYIRERFQIEERYHACAILAGDHSAELADVVTVLEQIDLTQRDCLQRLIALLQAQGWRESTGNLYTVTDGVRELIESHKVELLKNSIACKVQARKNSSADSLDFVSFRRLHECGVISAAILVMRQSELNRLIQSELNVESFITQYGSQAARCPLLLIGVPRPSNHTHRRNRLTARID